MAWRCYLRPHGTTYNLTVTVQNSSAELAMSFATGLNETSDRDATEPEEYNVRMCEKLQTSFSLLGPLCHEACLNVIANGLGKIDHASLRQK